MEWERNSHGLVGSAAPLQSFQAPHEGRKTQDIEHQNHLDVSSGSLQGAGASQTWFFEVLSIEDLPPGEGLQCQNAQVRSITYPDSSNLLVNLCEGWMRWRRSSKLRLTDFKDKNWILVQWIERPMGAVVRCVKQSWKCTVILCD